MSEFVHFQPLSRRTIHVHGCCGGPQTLWYLIQVKEIKTLVLPDVRGSHHQTWETTVWGNYDGAAANLFQNPKRCQNKPEKNVDLEDDEVGSVVRSDCGIAPG